VNIVKYIIFIYLFFISEIQSKDIPIIVISPSKTPQSLSSVGSSVHSIGSEYIEGSNSNFIGDIISNSINGANYFKSGGHGTISGIQLRGLPKRYSTVYIDGVKMSDPSSPDNSFYFSNLMKSSIKNIEILKGSQSSIYGSGAIGGTININTKNGKDKNLNNVSINRGSNNTNNVDFSFGKDFGNYDYYLGLSNFSSDGISAMNDAPGTNDKDSYDNESIIFNYGYLFNESIILRSSLRNSSSFLNYDEVKSDRTDKNNNSKENEFSYNLQLKYKNKNFKNTLTYNYTDIERLTKTYQSVSKNYYGYRDALNFISEYNFDLDTKMIFGIDNEFDRAKFQKDWPTDYLESDEAIYSQYIDFQFRPMNRLFTTIGGRRDDHTTAGAHETKRITLAYELNQLSKFRTSYGTGLRFPSLYDYFYGTNVQNKEELKPEKSKSFEFGYDTSLNHQNLDFSATIYNLEYSDPLEGWMSNSWKVKNSKAKIKSKGIEFYSIWRPIKNLNLKLNYNFSDTYDGADCDDPDVGSGKCIDESMVRVPRHSSSLELIMKNKKITNSIITKYSGETRDYGNVNNNFNDVVLDDYIVFNYDFLYNLNSKAEIKFNIDNVFDQNYETAYMYSSLGRNINLMFKKRY